MTRLIPSRFLMIAAAAAALILGIAPNAKAGTTPNFYAGWTTCGFRYDGAVPVSASYSITAADQFLYVEETQRVYVRTALQQYVAGSWVYASVAGGWMHGLAFDLLGPQQWQRSSDGSILGGGGWRDYWTVRTPGYYRIVVQFAWDRSSTGAPAGSSPWIASSGWCQV